MHCVVYNYPFSTLATTPIAIRKNQRHTVGVSLSTSSPGALHLIIHFPRRRYICFRCCVSRKDAKILVEVTCLVLILLNSPGGNYRFSSLDPPVIKHTLDHMPALRSQVLVRSLGSMRLGRALTLRGRGNNSFTTSRGILTPTVTTIVVGLRRSFYERGLETMLPPRRTRLRQTVTFLRERVH